MSDLQTFKSVYLPKDPRFCVFGKTGGGKSYFVNHYLIPKLKPLYRIVILDVKNEYANTYPALTLDDFKHRNFIRRVNQIKTKDEIITNFDTILEIVAGICLQVKYIILVIEEAPMILKKSYNLYTKFPNYAQLLFQGRSDHRGVIQIAQSPTNLHNDTMRQASDLFVFQMEPVDEQKAHQYFGHYINFETIRESEFSFWEKAHNQIYQKIKVKNQNE